MAYSRNASTGYGTITTSVVADGVLRAIIKTPPINLFDYKLATDFVELLRSLNTSKEIKVVIFDSALEDHFIAHLDIGLLAATNPSAAGVNEEEVLQLYVKNTRLLSNIDIITIAEIDGRASGAGSELAVQCDMRFAGPHARLSQLEVSLGLFPAAGGVRFLVKQVGRARALEYILAARGIDSKTAERIGWVNTAYASSALLRSSVDDLAKRIALFPRSALAAIKRSINYDQSPEEHLNRDVASFGELMTASASQQVVQRFLQLGNESKNEFELGIPESLVQLYK